MQKKNATFTNFSQLDIRIGTIEKAEIFEEARKPAYKLWINFGELGIKKTSAQITKFYSPENLINKQVVAVVNFEAKQIGNFMSECLVLGAIDEDNGVTLLSVEKPILDGLKVG